MREAHDSSYKNSGVSQLLGSKPNGLPPGVALHAEFRALAAAGLNQEQVLRAAGVNAAAGLGLGLQIGRIAVGAVADFVFVNGDPLSDINDAINVVAVVRNGRFFSAVGLIERAKSAANVELFDKLPKKNPPLMIRDRAAGEH